MPLNFNSFNFHPNFGPNSSHALPNFGFNIHNDARHGADFQLVLNNVSNFCQNQGNCGQNDLISQNNSQLSLSQRLSDLIRRNNYPSQNRVQVQSFIDYFPVENQPGVSEVTVTEVVKTKFLTANSTHDWLLARNDQFFLASQEPNFRNRSLLMSNQPNQPSNDESLYLLDAIFNQNLSQNQFNLPNTTLLMANQMLDHPLTNQNEQLFHNIYNQNPTQNQPCLSSPRMSATMSSHVNSPFTESKPFQSACNPNPAQNQSKPNSIDLADHPMAKNDDQMLDPEPMSIFVSHESKYDKNPSDHEHYPNNDHPLQKPIHELLDECYRNLVGDNSNNPLRSVPRNQYQVPKRFGVEISDDDEKTEVEDNDDGRTHSLSHRKYGPYTCPKCKKVYVTSQFFAAHVSASHYKCETITERKRRLAAKHKKKNLRLVHSSDGLTLVPDRSFKRPAGRRKKVKIGIKIEQDQVQKEGDDSFVGATMEDDKLVDVVVKEEYV